MSDDPFDDTDERGDGHDDADDRDDTAEPTARRDPFDELGDASDREGDPFEHLGGPDEDPRSETDTAPGSADADRADRTDPTEAGWTDQAAADADEGFEPDPFEYMGDEQRGSGPEPAAGPESAADSPVGTGGGGQSGGTTDPLGDVAAPGEDPFEAPGGVFEQVDVGEVDPDRVWERLTGEPEPDPTDDEADDVVDVSKHSFCEGCEFFSAPPDVHCTHEGTEILEFVDVETVRVANCPVVAERRELGSFEE